MHCFGILLSLALFGSAFAADCKDFKIQRIDELPDEYKNDAENCTKFVSAAGIPILGQEGVKEESLKETARIIAAVVGTLQPGFLDALTKAKQRVVLWPASAGKGEGGSSGNYFGFKDRDIHCDAKNTSDFGWFVIGGFGGAVHGVLQQVNASLQQRLVDAMNNARDKKFWHGKNLDNDGFYFQDGTHAWFQTTYGKDCDNGAIPCTRDKLKTFDTPLYDVLSHAFQAPNWVNECAKNEGAEGMMKMLKWACQAAVKWYQARGSHDWVYKCSEACDA